MDLEKYEEKYISAYCRLSYVGWYEGYRDQTSKYINCHNMDEALRKAKEELKDCDVIRVDGVAYVHKYGMRECMESLLYFLCTNENHSISLALPYEEHKEADRMVYDRIDELVSRYRFLDDVYKAKYAIMIQNLMADCYLSIGQTSELRLFTYDETNRKSNIANIRIPEELYQQVLGWARNYIYENKREKEFMMMGEYHLPHYYNIDFNCEELGIVDYDRWRIISYEFETVKGNGVITKLLMLPELAEFIKEELY